MSLFKQGALVAGARLVDKIMSLAIVLVLSRHFGEQGLGEFNDFFSLVSLFAPLTDFGAGMTLLQRWHDRDHNGRRLLFTQLVILKCVLCVVAMGLAVGGDALNHWGEGNPGAVCAAMLALFLDEFSELLRRPAHAQGLVWLEAVFPLLSRICQLAAVLAYLTQMSSGYQALYIYAAANAVEAVLSIVGAYGYPPTLAGVRRSDWWDIVQNGMPFAFSSLFVMATLHFDSVMLGHYSFRDVGAYSAATRIIMVLNVLNGGMCHALFPKLMQAKAAGDRGHAGWLINGMLRGFTILFGGIAIGGAIVGNALMHVLYGSEFTETGAIFQLLSPLILISAFYSLLGQCLEILGEQRKVMRIYAVSAVLNIGGNLLLIPYFGMYGSAAATLLSGLYTVAMLFRAIFRNTHVAMFIDGMGRAVVFLVLLGVLYAPLYKLSAWVAVPLGGVIFALLLVPFRSYWLEGMGKLGGGKKTQI